MQHVQPFETSTCARSARTSSITRRTLRPATNSERQQQEADQGTVMTARAITMATAVIEARSSENGEDPEAIDIGEPSPIGRARTYEGFKPQGSCGSKE